jgi:hypothetical protein
MKLKYNTARLWISGKYGNKILKLILKNKIREFRMDPRGSGQNPVAASYEPSNGLSGSTKCGNFF